MIWEASEGPEHIGLLQGRLFRLVESQGQIATLGYVDTLEEQALLEELLDSVKPPYPADTETLHYLLKSPFRYPPLRWGSRFGRTHEPSLFYGGGTVHTTLAESAYYRFVFWYSMEGPSPKDRIRSEHTLFSARYHTPAGVRLQQPPFTQHLGELTHPSHYLPCQLLGSAMRAAGVQAFEYPSARDPERGHCIALFAPAALRSRQPDNSSLWLCELSAQAVSFKQIATNTLTTFMLPDFLVDGDLPLPA